MTDLYLAGFPGDSQGRPPFNAWDWATKPLNLLASFAYPGRLEIPFEYPSNRRMLDSGAFTAHTKGAVIDIEALIVEAQTGRWDEVVALDVIGDSAASVRNADLMLERGVQAMPVFHIGDPWEDLAYYCSTWPKVGLSCRFGEGLPESLRFYDACFARAWPHRLHSFGWLTHRMLRRYPFHSADSSTWITKPARFREHYVKAKGWWVFRHLRTSGTQVTAGVLGTMAAYWDMQCEAKATWARELARLED